MIRTALLPRLSENSLRYRQDLLSVRRTVELIRSRLPSGLRTLERRFVHLRTQYFQNYWRQVAADIGAGIEEIADDFFRLSRHGQQTFVRLGEVMLDDHLTLRLAGNKPLVNRLLREQGFAVPDYLEYDLHSIDKALHFLQESGGNCVVKPASGAAGGRGVCTGINTKSRLIQASCRAAAHSANAAVMIEKQHSGGNYRLLYLNGEFIDAIRRDSPRVTGDGSSSIRTLVDKENTRRLFDGQQSLSPLTLDLDACYTLADQGLSMRHVPAAETTVQIKTACNQYTRQQNQSVKQTIHPSIVDFGRHISGVLGVTLSGVDLMLSDHTVSLANSHCQLNEINTTPGLHHHSLIANPSAGIPVGSIILDYILSQAPR